MLIFFAILLTYVFTHVLVGFILEHDRPPTLPIKIKGRNMLIELLISPPMRLGIWLAYETREIVRFARLWREHRSERRKSDLDKIERYELRLVERK